jgi:2-polyprenyl-6-hydroxyphenyl methylase/3-demethylubiquinone-9 3-methyltransferase
VRRYLEAEVAFVRERVRPGDRVLELGCGFGRVLAALAPAARIVVGVDTSLASLASGRRELAAVANVRWLAMDALRLGFRPRAFDVVCCIQNGISAFHAPWPALVAEALRVTRAGGRTLFSSYTPAFWPERLAWFEAQAAAGLVGELDYERTRPGFIVCKDGFTGTTASADDFRALAAAAGARAARVVEADGSSLFCEMTPE